MIYLAEAKRFEQVLKRGVWEAFLQHPHALPEGRVASQHPRQLLPCEALRQVRHNADKHGRELMQSQVRRRGGRCNPCSALVRAVLASLPCCLGGSVTASFHHDFLKKAMTAHGLPHHNPHGSQCLILRVREPGNGCFFVVFGAKEAAHACVL